MPLRILVTGTSYGLGAAISAAVRARGDVVVSLSRTQPEAGDEHWTSVDFGRTQEIGSAVARLAKQSDGPFDGIVLNAAVADKSVDQWTTDEVERHLRVNALAPVELWNQLEAAELLGSPCNVVLMGSFLQNGNVRQPAYAMSKAALWAWMRSYTMNQPIDGSVSMNMIWPARVETPANPRRELPPGDPNSFYSPERVTEVVVNYLYQAPSGPRGTVVDMGRS